VKVRARVRSEAEMPAPCCAKMGEVLAHWRGKIVTINPFITKKNCFCTYCKATFTGVPILSHGPTRYKGWYINPRYWEIDEGATA